MTGALLAAVLLVGRAEAGAGRTSLDFTHWVLSPRAAGMGDAGVALADDLLSAVDLNPAALARLRYPEAAFVYSRWYEGVQVHHGGYAHPFGRFGTAAVSGTWLRIEPIPGFNNNGARVGDVSAGDTAIRGDYAARLFGPDDVRYGLYAGGGFHHVRETLDTVSASTLLMDAGLLARFPVGPNALGLGLSLTGAGNGLRYDAERDPAPTQTRVGASLMLPALGDPLAMIWEARLPAAGQASHGGGIEYVTRGVLAVRLGWTTEAELGSGLRFGAGFNLKVFRLDYALAHFGSFGFTHRMAISTRFGEPIGGGILSAREEAPDSVQRYLERGDRFMEERRYYEAALEYNTALKIDPLHREAMSRLRYARDMIQMERR